MDANPNPDPEWTEDDLTTEEMLALMDPEEIDTDELKADPERDVADTFKHIGAGTRQTAEQMSLSVNDIVKLPNETLRIKSFGSLNFSAHDRDGMQVADAKNIRSGTWGYPIWGVYKHWRRGEAKPVTLKLEVEE